MRTEVGQCVHETGYRLLGGRVRQYMNFFQQMESWSRDELLQYQLKQVQVLVEHAYRNVPFYRKRFDDQGLKPGDIRSLEDFAMVKPLQREDLRTSGGEIVALPKDRRLFARTTSGSSGVPTTIYKDSSDLAIMDAMMWHLYGWHGLRMGEPQARIWGTGFSRRVPVSMRIRDFVLNRRRLSAFEITPENCLTFFRTLQKFKPTYMYCYPNVASRFADLCVTLGYDLWSLSLRVIVVTGEMLYPGVRTRLDEAFGAKVVNEYGATECGILAFECEAGSLHVPVGTIVLESVPSVTQRRTGKRIVVTDLLSRAMPLLRYEIGDMGEIGDHECACQRPFPVVRELNGREGSIVVRSDGGFADESMFGAIFKEGIQQFRVLQRSPSHFDVQAVKSSEYTITLEGEYIKRMRECLGGDITVRMTYVEELDLDPSGKLRSFVPLLEK